jgi:hypothetical protein
MLNAGSEKSRQTYMVEETTRERIDSLVLKLVMSKRIDWVVEWMKLEARAPCWSVKQAIVSSRSPRSSQGMARIVGSRSALLPLLLRSSMVFHQMQVYPLWTDGRCFIDRASGLEPAVASSEVVKVRSSAHAWSELKFASANPNRTSTI